MPLEDDINEALRNAGVEQNNDQTDQAARVLATAIYSYFSELIRAGFEPAMAFNLALGMQTQLLSQNKS